MADLTDGAPVELKRRRIDSAEVSDESVAATAAAAVDAAGAIITRVATADVSSAAGASAAEAGDGVAASVAAVDAGVAIARVAAADNGSAAAAAAAAAAASASGVLTANESEGAGGGGGAAMETDSPTSGEAGVESAAAALADKQPRVRRKMAVLLLSYSGTGYNGMQVRNRPQVAWCAPPARALDRAGQRALIVSAQRLVAGHAWLAKRARVHECARTLTCVRALWLRLRCPSQPKF
jgi:hypothetical protein